MSKSDTNNCAGESTGSNLTIIPGFGVADLAGSGLLDSLAGKVSAELGVFAERMHQGLLAAAVAVGVEVFDELLASEVTKVAGPKGRRDGCAITEIRSGSRLVGAIVHDAALKRDPGRLRAVAAAAGMALEVDRLNQQVRAQLDEVNASRSRIVEANDGARRRLERDLHDGAQQRLVALGLELQRVRRRVCTGADIDEVSEQLDAGSLTEST